MWTNSNRRPRSSYTVWSLGFLAFSGLFTWYMGWLPFSFEQPETGTLAENGAPAEAGIPDGDQPFLDGFDLNREQPDFDQADPVAFNSQSEPPVQEGRTTDGQMFGPPGTNGGRESTGNDVPDFPKTGDRNDLDVPFQPPSKAGNPRRVAQAGYSPETSPFEAGTARRTSEPIGVIQTGVDLPAAADIPPEAIAKLAEIDELLDKDNKLVAHRELSTLYWVKPEWRPFIKERIEQTAHSIYFADHPHYMQPYEVQPGDLLQSIGKQYDVPWEYLVRMNRIDPRKIRPGQKLKVIKGPFAARIDLRDFTMTIHAHGYYVHRFQVGIGEDDRTPIGKFKVVTKLVNPTYYGPEGNVVDANDPQNPLGERWIDIGDSFGIHGTIDPDSIGQAKSRGCIRLLNSDVEVVYDLLGVGSEVVIRK